MSALFVDFYDNNGTRKTWAIVADEERVQISEKEYDDVFARNAITMPRAAWDFLVRRLGG